MSSAAPVGRRVAVQDYVTIDCASNRFRSAGALWMDLGADGAVGPPSQLDGSERHGGEVADEHSAGERCADAGEDLDNLHRSQRAHRAGDRAEDGELPLPRRRLLRVKAL